MATTTQEAEAGQDRQDLRSEGGEGEVVQVQGLSNISALYDAFLIGEDNCDWFYSVVIFGPMIILQTVCTINRSTEVTVTVL